MHPMETMPGNQWRHACESWQSPGQQQYFYTKQVVITELKQPWSLANEKTSLQLSSIERRRIFSEHTMSSAEWQHRLASGGLAAVGQTVLVVG